MVDETNSGVSITLDQVEDLMKEIGALAKTQVMVGIPSSSSPRPGTPISNASLGYIHEYGSPARNIPARPWLFPPINAMQEEAVKMLQQAASLTLDKKPDEAKAQFEALGMEARNNVKNYVINGPFAPLAAKTIAARARRGNASVKPLLDTTVMFQSINYVVRNRDQS